MKTGDLTSSNAVMMHHSPVQVVTVLSYQYNHATSQIDCVAVETIQSTQLNMNEVPRLEKQGPGSPSLPKNVRFDPLERGDQQPHPHQRRDRSVIPV